MHYALKLLLVISDICDNIYIFYGQVKLRVVVVVVTEAVSMLSCPQTVRRKCHALNGHEEEEHHPRKTAAAVVRKRRRK